MADSDAQSTVSASNANILRLGEIGRVVARGIRTVAEPGSVPSFAASLADASRDFEHPAASLPGAPIPASPGDPFLRSQTSALPMISLLRPDGRHLGPVQANADGNVVAAGRPALAPATAPASATAASEAHSPALLVSVTPLMPATSVAASSALAAAQMADAQAREASTAAAAAAEAAAAAAAAGSSPTAPALIANAISTSAITDITATAATSSTSPSSPASAAGLKDYPRPARSDRSGVLNWNSTTPPTGRELEQLVNEARTRKAGWVTFVADPEYPTDYADLADRLTEAGIQPIARVEDPEGDLPARDVRALVQELKGHGVRYFQLFDGANVTAETPDGQVDVRDYADRWLTAARAVVDGGGLPGVGALDAKGDYDDLGFMRQMLSVVKERGGADVLGQSWVALRGEKPGVSATSTDVDDLTQRASWFDRINRRELGRSLPILVTGDPAGLPERLTAQTASTATSPVSQTATAAETALRDSRRKLPSLFGASRGTLAPARR